MRILTMIAAAAVATVAVPAVATAAPAHAPTLAVSLAAAPAMDQHHHRRSYWRTVCTTKWHHGHRSRVCRKVRAWR